jgi:hypothetical protein
MPTQVEMFTEDAFAEGLTLAGRLHDLRTAPTTSDHDRKEILRALIDRVYVDAFDREQIALAIEWTDGHPESPCAYCFLRMHIV